MPRIKEPSERLGRLEGNPPFEREDRSQYSCNFCAVSFEHLFQVFPSLMRCFWEDLP